MVRIRQDFWVNPSANRPSVGHWLLMLLAIVILNGNSRPLAADTGPDAGPGAVYDLIAEAMANNQDIAALEAAAIALQAQAPFAGSLQDPVAGIGLLNVPVDSFELDQEAMTQKQLFIAQKFPWLGTLDLRQQEAELKALEAGAALRGKKLAVARDLVVRWYDLGFIDKSLEVNAKLEGLITQVLRVAESRYATGKGVQQEILFGQVQLSELLDEAVSLQTRERMQRAMIGSLLNRESSYSERGPLQLADGSALPPRSLLLKAMLQHNPQLEEKKIAIDRARVAVNLAELDYMPDFDVRLSYGQREDNPANGTDRADFLSATLAMSVPLYQSSRQDSQLAAARKRLLGAEKSAKGLRNSLLHRLDALLAEIDGAEKNYLLYREGIAVQAVHLADAALAAYAVSKVSFETMLAARVKLLRIELKKEQYLYVRYKKLAELEELVGTSLSTLEGMK